MQSFVHGCRFLLVVFVPMYEFINFCPWPETTQYSVDNSLIFHRLILNYTQISNQPVVAITWRKRLTLIALGFWKLAKSRGGLRSHRDKMDNKFTNYGLIFKCFLLVKACKNRYFILQNKQFPNIIDFDLKSHQRTTHYLYLPSQNGR